jgi:pyruvate dehydrogenase E2 component (dihydrolipoamide acetyltransferase)
MPRLSDTMEEGTILRWLKGDGEEVHRGDELVEIETDKAAMTYEADQDGVLETLVAEGDTLPIGQAIARIGHGAPSGLVDSGRPADGDGSAEQGAGEPAHVTGGIDSRAGARAREAAVSDPRPASLGTNGATTGASDAQGRIKASPLARRVARERGVDLSTLSGSGPGGRIVRADVNDAPPAIVSTGGAETSAVTAPAAVPPGAPAPAPAPAPDEVTTAKGATTIVELSRTQQTIARRMAESKATIPDFSIHTDVDMEECVRLRTALKRLLQPADAAAGHDSGGGTAAGGSVVPTYNDMLVKASALALRDYPHANGGYRDGRLLLNSRVNVGVAVAAENALVVPTVFDADEKSLGEIARETRALAERVRTGTITPPELGGGTFTVSNLGMYGVSSFTAIINPPQAAILSVGALAPRAVVRDREVVARNTVTLTLACDHRILYGADAAQFLARIRELLEAPTSLTL